jgi:hypothetical protein
MLNIEINKTRHGFFIRVLNRYGNDNLIKIDSIGLSSKFLINNIQIRVQIPGSTTQVQKASLGKSN